MQNLIFRLLRPLNYLSPLQIHSSHSMQGQGSTSVNGMNHPLSIQNLVEYKDGFNSLLLRCQEPQLR